MNEDTHAVDAHAAAAQEPENTATSHRTAADHCNKGNHEARQHHAKVALDQFVKAHEASTLADTGAPTEAGASALRRI
jgi:hypothetical protein